MERERKGFHVLITNNETREVVRDCDALAIIGAFSDGECTCAFNIVKGGVDAYAGALAGTSRVCDQIKQEHPEVYITALIRQRLAEEEEGGTNK